ncbi:pentapeptide repeat-containing protein [Actinoallomurus vinaceus]|uniref:pentapeptide repeat-containing protein n=1 Tax=Actinoallomurus vinaceus TaxID=1080074 RepID=UPI0031E984D4
MKRDPEHSNDAQFIVEQSRRGDRQSAGREVSRRTEELIDKTGRGLDLAQADFSNLDLSGFDLRKANLNRAGLFGTRLIGADLSGSSLVCAGIERTKFNKAVLRGAYVHALAAQASDFSEADMRELVDATGSLFHGCFLVGAQLGGAELAGATFYQCNFGRVDLSNADLHGAVFNECTLKDAVLIGAHLDNTSLTKSNVRGAVLRGSRGHGLVIQRPTAADGLVLENAHLPSLRLLDVRGCGINAESLRASGIDVEGGDLSEISLCDADLRHGRIIGASMNAARLDRALLQESSWRGVTARGVQGTGIQAEGFTATECSLADAVLTRFAGRYATFRNCDLSRADLEMSYLYRASVIGDPPASASMRGVRLDGANLTQAYLAADFTEASLPHGWATYARINQSVFDGADLRGTLLFRASAVKTEFNGAQLGGQRGGLLADRCIGLAEALRGSKDPEAAGVADAIEELAALLARDPGKST